MRAREGKYELLCIGNVMVDVFSRADPDWLDGQGITEGAQHVSAEQGARLLSRASGDPGFLIAPGGAAANVARVAAMLGLRAAFAGCAGDDENGALFKGGLEKDGVETFLKKGAGQTGLCLAFDAPGGARIAACPGAAQEFGEEDAPEALIAGADAVALDGYMLDRGALARRVLTLASRSGIPVAVDAASVFQIRDKTEAILQYSRGYPLIVFMNADESIVFYNTIRKGGADDMTKSMSEREKESFILREICPVLKLMTEGDIFPVIVIKMGSRGAVALAGGNVHRAGTFAVAPKNTVGAGDAFCAAFMSAWIRGRPIPKCAAFGNRVAREALSVRGANLDGRRLARFRPFLRVQ